MAVVSAYLAVWDLRTRTRSLRLEKLIHTHRKTKEAYMGFSKCCKHCRVVFLSPPHNGVDGEPGASTKRFTGLSESSL